MMFTLVVVRVSNHLRREKVVEMSNQTDNSNNIAEDMPKTDSSSSFDVHILNLEESYIQGSKSWYCWYCHATNVLFYV